MASAKPSSGHPRKVSLRDGLTWNVDLQNTEKIATPGRYGWRWSGDLPIERREYTAPSTTSRTRQWVLGPRKTMSVQDTTPPAPFGDANVKTADIDFDKRIDIIQSSAIGEAPATNLVQSR